MATTHTTGEAHSDVTNPGSRPFLNPNLPSYDILKTLRHFDFMCTDEGLVGWAKWRLRFYSPNGAGLCCDSCLLTRNLYCQMVEGGRGCRTCKDLDLWCTWNRVSPIGVPGDMLRARYNHQQLSTACDSCRNGREAACDPWRDGGCRVCRQQSVACRIDGNPVGSPREFASRSDPSRPDHVLDWISLMSAGRELLRMASMPGTTFPPGTAKLTVFSLKEPHIQQKLVNNLQPLPPATDNPATLAAPNSQIPGYPPPGLSRGSSSTPVWQHQQDLVSPASPLLSQVSTADSSANPLGELIDPSLLYQAPATPSSNDQAQWTPDRNEGYTTGTSTPESSQVPLMPLPQPSGADGDTAADSPGPSYTGLPPQPRVAYSAQPPQSAREYYTPEELPNYSHIVPIPREVVPFTVWGKVRPSNDRCVGCQRAHIKFRGPCGYEPTQGCIRCAKFGVVCVKSGFALPPHPDRPRGTRTARFGPCQACRVAGRFCDPSNPCFACATSDPPAPCERNTDRGLFDRPVPGDDMREFTDLWLTRPNDCYQPANYHVELARKWCEEKGQQWPGPEDIESLPPQNAVWVGDWDPEGPPPKQPIPSHNQTPTPVQTPLQTPIQVVGTPQQLPPDPTPSGYVPRSLLTPSPSLGPTPSPGHWRAELAEIPSVSALEDWQPGSQLPKLPSWVVEAAIPATPSLPYGVLIASGTNSDDASEQEIEPFEPFGPLDESLRLNPPYPDPMMLAPTDRWDWNNDAADEGFEGRLAQDGGPMMPFWGSMPFMPLSFVESLNVPDRARLHWYWSQDSAPRLVSVQADERNIAQHLSPLEDRTVEAATAVPVERAPSPPPPALPYAADRVDLIPADDADARPGLALIPLQRLWEPNGQLSGRLSLPERAMLTGGCQTLVHRQGAIVLCDKPCQSPNNPDAGGICESTEHHPSQRVWVCDDHDGHGRAVASWLLDQEEGGYIWAALRHYACVDCSEGMRSSHGRLLADSGCRVFAAQPALMADSQRIEATPPFPGEASGGTVMRGGRYGLFPGTGCGCFTKVTARRLCLPHRLAACLEVRRRHPLTRQYDAAHGALCPFCEGAPSVDPANLAAHLPELTWLCKCCFGVVTGVPVEPIARQRRLPQPVRPDLAAAQRFVATPDGSGTPFSQSTTPVSDSPASA